MVQRFGVLVFVCAVVVTVSMADVRGQQPSDDVHERLEAFENRLFELENRVEVDGETLGDGLLDLQTQLGDANFVTMFDAEHLNLGGFATTSFFTLFNDDDTSSAFDHTHLELIIAPSPPWS